MPYIPFAPELSFALIWHPPCNLYSAPRGEYSRAAKALKRVHCGTAVGGIPLEYTPLASDLPFGGTAAAIVGLSRGNGDGLWHRLASLAETVTVFGTELRLSLKR